MKSELQNTLNRIRGNLACLREYPGLLGKRVLPIVEMEEHATENVEKFFTFAERRRANNNVCI